MVPSFSILLEKPNFATEPDDRVGTRSTLITSQLAVNDWHVYLNDPTLADAILDRVLHAAHKVPLSGESLRKPETL